MIYTTIMIKRAMCPPDLDMGYRGRRGYDDDGGEDDDDGGDDRRYKKDLRKRTIPTFRSSSRRLLRRRATCVVVACKKQVFRVVGFSLSPRDTMEIRSAIGATTV